MEEKVNVFDEISKGLETIVGEENVLTDDAVLERYAKDESWEEARRPEWAVKAKNTDQVQKIVQLANGYKVPVVPRSSAVGFHGSGIPEEGGIVIDLTEMNRILRIDTRNKWVLVENDQVGQIARDKFTQAGIHPGCIGRAYGICFNGFLHGKTLLWIPAFVTGRAISALARDSSMYTEERIRRFHRCIGTKGQAGAVP